MALDYLPNEYKEVRATESEKPILLSIGRLSSQKGFDVAIQTAKVMQDQNINFIWYIIGQGELREKFQKQINDAQVAKQSNFIRGQGESISLLLLL